jgi:hypothetical protein
VYDVRHSPSNFKVDNFGDSCKYRSAIAAPASITPITIAPKEGTDLAF